MWLAARRAAGLNQPVGSGKGAAKGRPELPGRQDNRFVTRSITGRHSRRRVWLPATAALLATSCASVGTATQSSSPRPRPARVVTATPSRVRRLVSHRFVSRRDAGLARPGLHHWVVLTQTSRGAAIDGRVVRLPDGAVVTVVRFRAGLTSFALHAGSQDPGPVAGSPHGDRVTHSERPYLVAAFNGAFKLSAGTGGYEQDGHVVASLRRGLATFVIDAAGRASVGVWRETVPLSGDPVKSVVQNLSPLVRDGRLSPAIDDRTSWGATLGRALRVARSGVGEDAYGNILYAASMVASPRDLASALASTGSVTAIEFDINPEWVQLDVAARPGAPLHVGIPYQQRPVRQLLEGWTRSFVTVLAPP